jgi:hypothetical protein
LRSFWSVSFGAERSGLSPPSSGESSLIAATARCRAAARHVG